jgi:hypothetical protein
MQNRACCCGSTAHTSIAAHAHRCGCHGRRRTAAASQPPASTARPGSMYSIWNTYSRALAASNAWEEQPARTRRCRSGSPSVPTIEGPRCSTLRLSRTRVRAEQPHTQAVTRTVALRAPDRLLPQCLPCSNLMYHVINVPCDKQRIVAGTRRLLTVHLLQCHLHPHQPSTGDFRYRTKLVIARISHPHNEQHLRVLHPNRWYYLKSLLFFGKIYDELFVTVATAITRVTCTSVKFMLAAHCVILRDDRVHVVARPSKGGSGCFVASHSCDQTNLPVTLT